jgi:hypothetical protein
MRSLLSKLFSLLRDAWSIIGLTLLLVLGLELVLGLFVPTPAERLIASWRNMADAEANKPKTEWARKHLNEIRENWLALEWTPFVHWRMKPMQGETITIGKDGFRPTIDLSNKNDPVLTLQMYGASTMVGWGTGDDATIPTVIARRLKELGYNVVVKNYGQWSYIAKQEALLFALRVASGDKPDIAVFYDGCNELIGPPQDLALGPIFSNRERREHALLSYERRYDVLKEWLLNAAKWSAIAQLITPKAAWEPPDGFIDEQTNRIETQYTEAVNLSQSIADANNISALYFWQPIAYHKPHLTDSEKGVLDLAEKAERGGDLSFWRRYVATVGERLGQHFSGRANFYDISDTYRDAENSLFMDLCHTNPAGYAMVAERMLPRITAAIDARKSH